MTIRRRRRREEGQAMVEFALVLPVLLLILLAIMKFGILFQNYLTLTDAVRTGARTLAISRGTTGYCTTAQNQVTGSSPGLNWSQSGASVVATPNSPDTCSSGLTSGNSETVTAHYPCDLTIMGVTLIPSCSLTVSATERVE